VIALRRLLVYMKPFWWAAVLAPLLMALEVAMDLAQPRLMQHIVDEGIAQGDLALAVHTGFIMIGVALVGAVGGLGCSMFAVLAGVRTGTAIRAAAFRKLQQLSFANLDRLGTGPLVTRLTNDVVQVQEAYLMLLRIMVRAPLLVVGSLIMAVITSPSLSILLAVIGPLLLAVLITVTRVAHPLFMAMQSALDRLNTVLQENLLGIRVVKAFVRSDHEKNRFGKANDALMGTSVRAARVTATVAPIMILLFNVGVVGVIWFGGLQVQSGEMHVGQVIAFMTYLLQMLFAMVMVGMLLMRLSRGEASARRVCELLDEIPAVPAPDKGVIPPVREGNVEFDSVTFSYDGRADDPVLRSISFSVASGETVAILGTTGGGKSTLLNLLPRFYDVTSGSVHLDGVDVRRIPFGELTRRIAVTPQETVLFSGTIRDNLRFGRPEATEEEITAAARTAEAHDFICSFPEGYDTILGQRGVNVSGGQKQRLAIARALVAPPEVLILDDCTSSVDVETEARILRSLRDLMRERTCFIITQKIYTALTADRILVVEDGRLVAEGTHAELLRSSAIYRDICRSQSLGGGGR
jgi:ATP-binding cassette subfamily B multidrug efflux pump